MIGTTTGLLGLVTTREAARVLGISPEAVGQRIHRHRIPVIYVGAALLVSLADLRACGKDTPR